MLPYQIKNKYIETMSYKKKMLTIYLFDLFMKNKNTASYGVMCITLVELHFTIGNCEKHHL